MVSPSSTSTRKSKLKKAGVHTLEAVAKEAGVSLATASYVLNGHAERLRISQQTTERVREAATKLNYKANPFASSLRCKRSYSLGVLWSFSGAPDTSRLIHVMGKQAFGNGYTTFFYDTLGELASIQAHLKELERIRVDGVIVQYTGPEERFYTELAPSLEQFAHVVVVSNQRLQMRQAQIIHSRDHALADAVRHLLATGKTRCAFLGRISTNRSKTGAIRTVLEAAGAPPLREIDIESLDDVASVLGRAMEEPGEPLEAILASTDELAAAAIAALRAMGRAVPEEVAVVGFNHSAFGAFFAPPIASVRRRDQAVGIQAIEWLLRQTEGGEVLDNQVDTVEMEFIWRESAGPQCREA